MFLRNLMNNKNLIYHYTKTEAAFSMLIPEQKNELKWLLNQIFPVIKKYVGKPQIEKKDSIKSFIINHKFKEHGYSSDFILLRAFNIENMNDTSEFLNGYNVLKKSYKNDISFDEAFKIVNQKKDGVKIFDQMYNNSYITSFSRIKNDLTQWRLYGDDGQGVAIGIDYDYIKNISETFLGICIDDVSYVSTNKKFQLEPKASKEEIERGKAVEPELTQSQKELLRKLANIQQIFLNIAFIKDECFKNEEECRLYVNPIIIHKMKQPSVFDLEDFLFNYHDDEKQYMMSKKKIVSYKEIPIPLSSIKEVWLGPKSHTEEHILNDYLNSLGYCNVKVIKSRLPYK